ncbi:PREDICTED: epididymal secretory protein E1-like isoform X2 [Amphimedon queenslandica]|uniref:MD-2-related lipid-recognition domain-containing protein n=1 Tax=Amphimedon queenslandica TaxID=400682 RepID=A0AAN0J7S2_AMPQE|nr:PREDICTED: epididymal secretory protein E1-like isoform X2 [Amphimedon queenslandica]|eukprot:XP_019853074.1 PREDICTED: epididymal secretory protein E1-like isoform X2 [Amphimedon queenslandica]
MKTFLLCLACLVSLAAAQIAQSCSDHPDSKVSVYLSSVRIVGCATPPCKFYKGRNHTVAYNFKANADIATMNVALYGKIAGIWVELPGGLPDPNICNNKNVTCPMKSGTEYSPVINVFVNPKYPSVSKTRIIAKMWLYIYM